MIKSVFTVLLCVHLLGDFYFQTQKMADKKVYMVSENEKEQITGTYIVQSRIENNHRIFLRILSSEKQTFEAVPPTLEDGYICCLKNM